MQAYEGGRPSYFATPPVNLIRAYHASLVRITRSTPSIEDRFKLHRETSARIKRAALDLGLRQVPIDSSIAANGMSAVSQSRLFPYPDSS